MKKLIKSAISSFSKGTLTENSLVLFKVLGYDTSITITQSEKTFKSFKENYVDNSPNKDRFNELKAYTNDWKSFDFLFQLADNLSGIKGGKVDNQIINSVVFACIELSAATYSRTQLAEISRQVNVLFAMPVVLLFKYHDNITLSVIHRRINKKDEQKDVLEKVYLIKDISIPKTHAAQILILNDFAFQNLNTKKQPTNYVELTNAWESVFNTKALNKQFFKKIANWYFLSVYYSKFPYEYLKSDPKHKDKSDTELQEIANQKATIRFITRMIFVWFLKEKGLISNDLFDGTKVSKILKKFNQENSSDYYNAILQNLFFATLNKAKEHREFALNKSFH